MEEEEKFKDFKCPICGGTEYDLELKEPVRFGGRNAVAYYNCEGCSAMFKDPKKFSQAKKE